MSIEVLTDIRPINDAPFPITKAKYIQGGYLSVGTIADLNAIYPLVRSTGMMVYVQSPGQFYQLVSGIDNSNWQIVGLTNYAHTQSIASSSWLINHNLGYNPNIEILGISGIPLIGVISYPTGGILAKVIFNQSYAGSGFCS